MSGVVGEDSFGASFAVGERWGFKLGYFSFLLAPWFPRFFFVRIIWSDSLYVVTGPGLCSLFFLLRSSVGYIC